MKWPQHLSVNAEVIWFVTCFLLRLPAGHNYLNSNGNSGPWPLNSVWDFQDQAVLWEAWVYEYRMLAGGHCMAFPSHKNTNPSCSWVHRTGMCSAAKVAGAASSQNCISLDIGWNTEVAIIACSSHERHHWAQSCCFYHFLFFPCLSLCVRHYQSTTALNHFRSKALTHQSCPEKYSCVLLTETFQFHKYLMKWLPIAKSHFRANCCCGQTTKLLSICLQHHITMNTADKLVIKVLEISPQKQRLFS